MPGRHLHEQGRRTYTLPTLLAVLALVSTLSLFATTPAVADDEAQLCGKTDLPPEHFVGVYTMEVGSGYVTDGDMKIPAPTTDTDTVKIFTADGELSLNDGAGTISGTVVDAEEPRWDWPAGVGKPPVSGDDLAVVTGCETDQLPRIVLSGSGTSADGQPMDYGYRLLEVQADLLVGILHWEGGGFSSKRWVTLERTR